MQGVAVIALAVVACSSRSAESRLPLDTQPVQSLVGAWDAKLSLNRPYQLEFREPLANRICGTIGFVENRNARIAYLPADSPRHVGVYDLDLWLFGLDWQNEQYFPTAVASAIDTHAGPANLATDSVSIVLNPGGQERIVLRGRYDAVGIGGAWTAQSSRGTASGSFRLTPHVNARSQSRSCT
jgi:hypothetical protein